MATNTGRFNTFLFLKLPAAWWCGVRLRYIDKQRAVVSVRYRWINQNPFGSMFWAVQGMAAELSTGAMVMQQIRDSGKDISMLVARNKAQFSKKATGLVTFRCEDGAKIETALVQTITTGEGQTLWMTATGRNEDGIIVSVFEFEWTVKVRR